MGRRKTLGQWLKMTVKSVVLTFLWILAGVSAAALFDLCLQKFLPLAMPWALAAGLSSFNPSHTAWFSMIMVVVLISLWGALQHQQWRKKLHRQFLHANFDGKMGASELSRLLRHQFDRGPREEVVTVMFIDIVGFSRLAEGQNSKQLFRSVNSHVRFISGLIHKHGGVVERFLGDGVLCYFRRQTGSEQRDQSHANRALQCAIAIQRHNLLRCKRAMAKEQPVYPIRIGLNTGNVLIGDLGWGARVDLTMIGHGVNFAKRMEQCCETFKIMLSSTTKELLHDFDVTKPHIHKKAVQVKHHDRLHDAFEVDPLLEKQGLVAKAERYYRDNLGIVRKEERVRLNLKEKVLIYSDFGEGCLFDHSYSGFGISLRRYLAQGCEINLRLDSHHRLSQILGKHGIFEVKGEVRWARPSGREQSFEHGILIRNLTRKQMSLLHLILTNYSSEHPAEDVDLLRAV